MRAEVNEERVDRAERSSKGRTDDTVGRPNDGSESQFVLTVNLDAELDTLPGVVYIIKNNLAVTQSGTVARHEPRFSAVVDRYARIPPTVLRSDGIE